MTIGEVLATVKRVWFELDDGKDRLELPILEIAKMLC